MSRPAERPLPAHLSKLLKDGPRPGDNLALWLDRFLPRDPNDFWSLTGLQRAEALHSFAQSWRSPSAAQVLARRAPRSNEGLLSPIRRRITLRLSGRLLMGAGSGSATEMNLTLDHLHGVPRLSGSGLKGLARAVAESEGGWSDQELLWVFGRGPERESQTAASAGHVEFLDALPQEGAFRLVTDVLTPHMGPWYRGEVDAPVEWLSPVPVSFLAVAETAFVFDLMAWPLTTAEPHDKLLERVDRAMEALKRGLMDLGLGGKTAVGYGYFEE